MYVFIYTKEYLEKRFSKEILDKYFSTLAFLFQNGYNLNFEDDEVDEQLSFFNYFQAKEDFENLERLNSVTVSNDAKKMVAIEFIDIIKKCLFVNKENLSPILMKTVISQRWKDINDIIIRMNEIFDCEDSEVKGILYQLSNLNELIKKVNELGRGYSKNLKVLTWLNLTSFLKEIYVSYTYISKEEGSRHYAISENINDELYGSIGNYNPSSKEIKSIIGSAVFDLKTLKTSSSLVKVKQLAKLILSENNKEDDEEIKYLIKWSDGKETDNDRARRVVMNSTMLGIINLLCLKYGLTFSEDRLNALKADKVYDEFNSILKYCGIEKEDINV